MMVQHKFMLNEKDLPTRWYNIQADLPFPLPPVIHPGTKRPIGPQDLAPLVCALYDHRVIEAVGVHQLATFDAALQFARTEGILSAPEPARVIRVVIDETLRCKESGERKAIGFVLCGHGHFDLGAYDAYIQGSLRDFEYPDAKIREALAALPKVG